MVFAKGSIQEKCAQFATELKKGKDFRIESSIFDPIFETMLLPPNHGLKIVMKLPATTEHNKYVENYHVGKKSDEEYKYRFCVQKTGKHKVACRYKTTNLNTNAANLYNESFANNRSVDVAKFLVLHQEQRMVEANAKTLLNWRLPQTNLLPDFVTLEMKEHNDFYQTSTRANFYDNSITRYLDKIKFGNTQILNPGIRDGTTILDFSEEMDVNEMFNASRRFMLGRETIDMSKNEIAKHDEYDVSARDWNELAETRGKLYERLLRFRPIRRTENVEFGGRKYTFTALFFPSVSGNKMSTMDRNVARIERRQQRKISDRKKRKKKGRRDDDDDKKKKRMQHNPFLNHVDVVENEERNERLFQNLYSPSKILLNRLYPMTLNAIDNPINRDGITIFEGMETTGYLDRMWMSVPGMGDVTVGNYLSNMGHSLNETDPYTFLLARHMQRDFETSKNLQLQRINRNTLQSLNSNRWKSVDS